MFYYVQAVLHTYVLFFPIPYSLLQQKTYFMITA